MQLKNGKWHFTYNELLWLIDVHLSHLRQEIASNFVLVGDKELFAVTRVDEEIKFWKTESIREDMIPRPRIINNVTLLEKEAFIEEILGSKIKKIFVDFKDECIERTNHQEVVPKT